MPHKVMFVEKHVSVLVPKNPCSVSTERCRYYCTDCAWMLGPNDHPAIGGHEVTQPVPSRVPRWAMLLPSR